MVQNKEILKQILNATSDFVSKILGHRKDMDFGAKTLIIISGTTGAMLGMEYANAGCIVENMLLAATSMGINNIVWAGAAAVISQDDDLKQLLGIPETFNPLLCASFGYAVNAELPKKHTVCINRV